MFRSRFSRSAFQLFVVLGLLGSPAFSQEPDPAALPSQTAQTATHAPPGATSDRDVSLRALPKNILADQKDIWLFPTKLAKGKHWIPTISIVGVSAALIVTDPHTAPTFRTTSDFSGFNRAFSDVNTAAFIAAVPASIYAIGLLKKDSYAQNTGLLAVEAVADGFALNLAFKGITGRKQPSQYAGDGPYNDSFFNGSHNPLHSGGFYSMHSMAAFAVATVVAHRYRNHRWVPFVAYGLAGAIAFSRITTSDHFPSDVFFGGAMGLVIARYAVLPARF
jgi:membrane-associated phospholipid phosphatase